MPWMELSVDTTSEAVDWVCGLLAKTGYVSHVAVSDAPSEATWEFTVRFYLPCDAYVNTRAAEIADLLLPLHRTGLATELQVASAEEISPTESPTASRRIGQRFVVQCTYGEAAPSLDRPEPADEVVLWLKPSLAFGSGLHPATVLSLRLLERHVVPGMKALDLGSGTGILSVAMAKLGAQVWAADNDEIAVRSTQETVWLNHVAQQVTVMRGSLGRGSQLGHWMGGDSVTDVPLIDGSFDLIVANILARVHIELASDFRQALSQSTPTAAVLITSGFTADVEPEVAAALSQENFEAIDSDRLNEWVALAHRLRV